MHCPPPTRMSRRVGGCGLFVCLLLLTSTANAHRGHAFGSPFHEITLEEACKLARDEHKLVFVYINEPQGVPPDYLDRPVWNDWRAIDLLIRETVAVQIDAAKDQPDIEKLDVKTPPEMLLLNTDGSLRRRWPGDADVNTLMEGLAASLSDEQSLQRVRAAFAELGPDDPLARERLAETLTRCGNYDEAAKHYRWCVEVGLPNNLPYAVARRRLVMNGFVRLARQSPDVRKTLLALRDKMEAELRAGTADANRARDYAELNRALDDEPRTLVLYNELPKRSKARYALFDRVFDQLVANRQYDDILAVLDPQRALLEELHLARRKRSTGDEGPDAVEIRGTRAFTIARGCALIEVLAGTGKLEQAKKLVNRLLRFDDSRATHDLLRKHAKHAQADALLNYLTQKDPG